MISHIGDNKHKMDAKPKQASSKMHYVRGILCLISKETPQVAL